MDYKRPGNPHVVCPECDELVHPMDLCCGQCVTNGVAQEVGALTDKLREAEEQIERYRKSIAITDANTRRMQRVIDVARRQKQRSIALTAALNELLAPATTKEPK